MATRIVVLDVTDPKVGAIEFLDRHLNDGFTLLACKSLVMGDSAYMVYTLYKPDVKEESETNNANG